MELFYVDWRLTERWPVGVEAALPAHVTEILKFRAIPDGMPVVLDAAMRPVEPLCGWFRSLALDRLQPETMRAYAQIVRRLGEFLVRRGTDLLSANDLDFAAYRMARTESQSAPVSEATWDKERAAIKKLYTWLAKEGHVRQVPRLAGRSVQVRRELDIRHMTLEQYRYFRDVGLAGMLPDGHVDPAYRGWAPHRSRAALELALMTGMRLQEWSTLLLPELGVGWRRPGEGIELTLQECAKYKLRRRVWVPPAALDAVEVFLRLERPVVVERAQRTLRRRIRDLFVVDRVDMEQRKLRGVLGGERRTLRIEALDPRMREATVIEGGSGLEPLAVFIGHGGGMLGGSRWDGIRKAAWRRMLEHGDAPQAPRLPVRAFRFHDARHTFALQLLITLLDRAAERSAAVRRGDRARISRDKATTYSAVLTVQKALGHLRVESTYHYLNYLDDPMAAIDEAFRGWAMDAEATYAEIGRRVLQAREVIDA